MMKRILCVICAVLVMLTLSIFVFAAPQDNIQEGNIIITGVSAEVSHSFPFSTPISLAYGQNHLIKVNYTSSNFYEDALYLDGQFTLTLTDSADIYFAYNAYEISNSSYDVVPQTGIESYRDSSKDFTDTNFIVRSGYLVSYDGDEDEVSYTSYTPTSNYNIAYKCYSNVPAGTYLIEYSYIYMPASGSFSGDFILGLYAVDPTPPGSDDPPVGDPGILDGFKDGTYTFEQALDMLVNNMQDVLDNIMLSTEYKNFYVNYTSAMIEILEKESDIIYNSSVSDFNDQGEVIIDSFIASDSQDVSTYISSLTNLFSSVLEQASSAEQGTFLSSCFQNLLAKLQLAYEMSLYDVVSDEEMNENAADKSYLKDLFADEDEAIEMFDRAQYESMLDFNEWISELKNYQQYRNIFEWFFSSSGDLRVFILMPFCFVLVSLLLGTTTVLVASERIRVRDEMRANLAVKKDYYNTRIKFYKSKMK